MQPIRFIQSNNKVYLLAEDVVSILYDLAETENIDTQSRIKELCVNISKKAHQYTTKGKT